MELSIKNLGLIETANLEIKDLTILCGKNNTSKTYLTYLIYCFFSGFREYISIDYDKEILELIEKILQK